MDAITGITGRQVRLKAVEIIKRMGWWNARNKDAPGCVPHGACLVISMVRASNYLINGNEETRSALATEAFWAATAQLVIELDTKMISDWNDTHTKEEVIEVLQRVSDWGS